MIALPSQVVSDDEDEDDTPGLKESQASSQRELISKSGDQEPRHTMEFDLEGPITQGGEGTLPNLIEDEEDSPRLENATAELLRRHHKLNHLSMIKMQVMAKQGILPKQLVKCDITICTSCLYGKATRRPWRTKPKKDQEKSSLRTAKVPGQCVSIDQLESRTPGLIAQVKGWNKKRYQAATIFVDHFSALSYVYLQRSTNAEETLAAKASFERYAERHGVKVQSYQADNGRFSETAFMQAIKEANQTITFCGVNAHFQNGVAERRIRSLQDQARTMIIHAQHRWPSAIDAHLWPYALRTANEVFNNAPTVNREDMKSPIELFSDSPIRPNLSNFQTFGCPVFVLDQKMQAGQKLPKWQLRARMGINLGVSNQHARNVALVLNLKTGHVSPQFHVKFDPKFEAVRASLGNQKPHLSGRSNVDSSQEQKSANQRRLAPKRAKKTWSLRGRKNGNQRQSKTISMKAQDQSEGQPD